MTGVLISGGLTFVVGLLILRPFSVTGGRLRARAHIPDDDRRRELLRQLRDLDDDLAAGKLMRVIHEGGYRGYVPIETLAMGRRNYDPATEVTKVLAEVREAIAALR